MLFQRCFKKVSEVFLSVFQGNFEEVLTFLMMLQDCCNQISRLSQENFKGVSSVFRFQYCLWNASSLFQRCCMDVLKIFKEICKCV